MESGRVGGFSRRPMAWSKFHKRNLYNERLLNVHEGGQAVVAGSVAHDAHIET